jgi:hypothetical protein
MLLDYAQSRALDSTHWPLGADSSTTLHSGQSLACVSLINCWPMPMALVRDESTARVGKIRDISKICKASGYANETVLVPGRDDEIGVLEHLLKDFRAMNRPSFS